jgi:hypothetical protein
VRPDPKDPQFFPCLRRQTKIAFFVIGLVFLLLFLAQVAWGAPFAARKEKLPRDDVYYEIVNDKDDFGNYIETYRIPNGRGGKVYCIVYSDKIGDGGGAGISCDWEHAQ